ncbi:unnamed protein product [Rhizophagus irregularis]|nr:unnamed protein product [Rhizophagus irregularis]
MVNMKSVLYQSKDKITFIVTLHDSNSSVHIIFNGDHFIEYYKIIMVGEMYFFKNIKPRRTFNEDTQFPVFVISSIDSIENVNRELAITYNSSNPTEQIQHLTDLACSCFDSEYILHLGKYPEYNPSITPYRLGMKLLLYNIHAIKFTMKEDIWRLDNNKNCPNFRDVKVILLPVIVVLFEWLLRKYRAANCFEDLAQEYFNHKVYCCITEENQEIDIRLPPISEVLHLINELVISQRFSSEICGENQLKGFHN